MCESVKEKLETNAYENVEAVNYDLNQIKEAYFETSNGLQTSVTSILPQSQLMQTPVFYRYKT